VFDGGLPSKTRCGTSQSGLLGCLTEGKRLGLSENIGQQHVVMLAKWIQGLGEGDEVARDEPSTLMDQLVKRVATAERILTIRLFGQVTLACGIGRGK